MRSHIVSKVVTVILASVLLVPLGVVRADSFSFQVYPNNGFAIAGCGSSGCARVYQYGQGNVGIVFAQPQKVYATQKPVAYYKSTYTAPQYVRYTQPAYANYYQPRQSHYVPYFVIQQNTPSYYQQADPGAYYRDFYAAQYNWDSTVRQYNAY